MLGAAFLRVCAAQPNVRLFLSCWLALQAWVVTVWHVLCSILRRKEFLKGVQSTGQQLQPFTLFSLVYHCLNAGLLGFELLQVCSIHTAVER